MTTYFISGHLDLTPEEFEAHYVPKLIEALADPDSKFIVGDARGADAMAQKFLSSRTENVTIFHMFERPRNFVKGYGLRGGFKGDAERDITMTRHSDADIAWVRNGREESGTAKNLNRRKKPEKSTRWGTEARY